MTGELRTLTLGRQFYEHQRASGLTAGRVVEEADVQVRVEATLLQLDQMERDAQKLCASTGQEDVGLKMAARFSLTRIRMARKG